MNIYCINGKNAYRNNSKSNHGVEKKKRMKETEFNKRKKKQQLEIELEKVESVIEQYSTTTKEQMTKQNNQMIIKELHEEDKIQDEENDLIELKVNEINVDISMNEVMMKLEIERVDIAKMTMNRIISKTSLVVSAYDEKRFGQKVDTIQEDIRKHIEKLTIEFVNKYDDWQDKMILHAKRERTKIEQKGEKYLNWESYCLFKVYSIIIHANFDD